MHRVVAAAFMVVAGVACQGSAPASASVVETTPATGSASAAAASATTTSKVSHDHEHGELRPHNEQAVVECLAQIPEHADDDVRLQTLLDQANKDIERGNYAGAWTCADRATDLAPASV